MSLDSFYKMLFDVRYFVKLTFEEIYAMSPFELEIYISMWEKQKQDEKEANKDNPLGGLLSGLS